MGGFPTTHPLRPPSRTLVTSHGNCHHTRTLRACTHAPHPISPPLQVAGMLRAPKVPCPACHPASGHLRAWQGGSRFECSSVGPVGEAPSSIATGEVAPEPPPPTAGPTGGPARDPARDPAGDPAGSGLLLSLRASGSHLMAVGVHACATNAEDYPVTLRVLQVPWWGGGWWW